MSDRKKQSVKILENTELSAGIFSMIIDAKDIANACKAGQFIDLYTKDNSKLLPRPISICNFDREQGTVRMVYRISGEGTKQFSALKAGDCIDVLGPIGNGYDIETITGKNKNNTLMVIGGGIGIPPMLGLSKVYKTEFPEAKVIAVLGYRDKNTFLDNEFKQYADVYYSSDDGSIGTKGTVIDAIKENGLTPDVIAACGPTPMQRGVKSYACDNNIIAYLSLEERMACGIGACLGCVCKTKDVDDHSKVHNKRVCKDGPVFLSTEVEI